MLKFEFLETRALLAGNVTALVTAGELDITGDAASNSVQVWQTGDGKDAVALTDVTVEGDLSVKTNGGTDAVSLNTVNVGSDDDLSVDVGPGNYDTLSVVNCTAGSEVFSDTGGTNGTIVGALNHFATSPVVSGFSYEFGI